MEEVGDGVNGGGDRGLKVWCCSWAIGRLLLKIQ